MRSWVAAIAVMGIAGAAFAQFRFEDNKASLTILEKDKPVLVYNYEPVKAPDGVPPNFTRACYIHPLYGLDGEIMTQDFPIDHFHHRGVFWAWPECKVGDRRMDDWALADVHQHQKKWITKKAGPDKAEVAVENFWAFDDAPDKAQIKEDVAFTVLPADATGRAIDFDLKLTNVSDQVVTFLGAKNKGYGGFCLRPDAKRLPMTFTTASGVCKEDALRFDTPWADVSFQVHPKGPYSGVAIFEHPKDPGFPFPGWIFRHYGFLGASWPHEQEHTLKPGESFELLYRLYIHRGTAEEAGVDSKFDQYLSAVK